MHKDSKAWLTAKLRSWRETFDNEGDEEGHKEIGRLLDKIAVERLTKNDWDNIIFHLWQISHGDE